MMITTVNANNYHLLVKACQNEPIFGSRILSHYTIDPDNVYMQLVQDKHPSAAWFFHSEVCVMVSDIHTKLQEISEFITMNNIKEIDTNIEHCNHLQEILGGDIRSSYYMYYYGDIIQDTFKDIYPVTDLEEVFAVLQQSHSYYQEHFQFPSWAAPICAKIEKQLAELYIMYDKDMKPYATGSITASGPTHEVIAAICVIPEHRGKGAGRRMSSFLTNRVLSKGKIPCLISGYDEVSQLYTKIGYKTAGRWGELYINE